jgi:uncharacterized protein (UPF0332 family)
VSFNWNQYFELAQALAGDGDANPSEEAKKRSAISRAYYSVLIQAREKASERSGENYPTDGGTHGWTIHKYKNDDSPNTKGIGAKIERLKELRERVDYDNQVQNLDKEVRGAIQQASLLLHKIQNLPS